MKKIYILSALALVLVSGYLFVTKKANANPSTLQTSYLGGGPAISSSTATYLATATASSTLVVLTDGQDQFDLNLQTMASSTSAIVNFQVDYSDDYGCVVTPTSCNWYREDKNTVSGSIITHSNNTFHTWTPASVASTTKNITFTSIGARFMRVGFAAQTANSTIWAQVASKGQTH